MSRMNPLHAATAAACLGLVGCLSHRVSMDPIEVKPIHVTVDVNVRVQRELDKFFDYDTPSETRPSANQDKAGQDKPGQDKKE
jgi:hypothetical protein